MTQSWFDGHLDLAFLAEQGRDLTRDAADCGGMLQPASITFPALRAGNVTSVLGTIFIQRRITRDDARARGVDPEDGPWCYATPQEAAHAARRQLAIYADWHRAGLIRILTRKPEAIPATTQPPLQIVLLLEGAAGITRVEDFADFYDAGVRVVSLTWAEGSPWSGGDQTGGDVTPAGKKLLAAMDDFGIIHDVSHLSEQAFWTVLAETRGPKVASHSNCRALLPGRKHPERHLSDEQIRALAAAGGIIGLNLYSHFLVAPESANSPASRARIDDILRHIRHMEQLVGRRDFLALGSDMDGGFAADQNPADLEGPPHLHRLAEALSHAGWTDREIDRFACRNWQSILAKVGVSIPAPAQ